MYQWSNILIKEIRMKEVTEIEVGASYHVEADVFLGGLLPEDVIVEVFGGRVDPSDRFVDRFNRAMKAGETAGDRIVRYQVDIRFEEAGRYGLNIRITPNHPNRESRHAMGLVIWGQA